MEGSLLEGVVARRFTTTHAIAAAYTATNCITPRPIAAIVGALVWKKYHPWI